MRIPLTLLFFLISTYPTPIFAQSEAAGSSARTLLVDRALGDDPVRIERVLEGTTELKDDGHRYPNVGAWETMFDAGDDWLKDVSFVVKNVSKKKITYLEVGCALAETNDWVAEIKKHQTPDNPGLGLASNIVGWRPKHALYSLRLGREVRSDEDRRPPFELPPGHEFSIALQDPEGYARLKSGVEARQPMSTVTACNAMIGEIFFEDGTRWQGHRYLRAAEQPGRWTTISFDEWSTMGNTAEQTTR